MNSTLPTFINQSKPARDFQPGWIVRYPKSKNELLANTQATKSYHRYMVVKALGMCAYGYRFWVRDLDSAELKQQGFGSQTMWVVEGKE